MSGMSMLLPDGRSFAAWDDATIYRRVWHVDQAHPAADDGGPGSAERPFRHLAAAAERAGPGERVLIAGGVYRECLSPARGGSGADAMIHYQAAPGATVVLSAAMAWTPEVQAVERPGRARTWWATLPSEQFVGYHPFLAVNLSRSDWFPWQKRPLAELHRAWLRRGQVFQDGRRLEQVANARLVAEAAGRFWVSDDATRLLLRLYDDADPASAALELSLREQCVAPRRWGLGWIRLSGLVCRHAANGIPWPQHGAISTSGGHHWLIEDCVVEDANALGIDIGQQNESRPEQRPEAALGGHIVRRNAIRRCGHAGIDGTHGVRASLIADNLFEDLGHLGLEHVYEAAAIKFHHAVDMVISGNTIRRLHDCCGIWLDWLCGNNTVSGNHIHDLRTVLAGIYIEANREPHLVEGNLVHDIRDVPGNDPPKDGIPGGIGISIDVSDHVRILDNLVARCDHFAIACHLAQKGRVRGGSSAACRGMRITGNLVLGCALRVLLARRHDNVVDGNRYGGIDRPVCFTLEEPDRVPRYDLRDWREVAGFDLHSSELPLVVERPDPAGPLVLRGGAELPELSELPWVAAERLAELRSGAAVVVPGLAAHTSPNPAGAGRESAAEV